MAPLKASGVDGLHAQFYQSQWVVVGESLISIVKKGFNNGEVEAFLNKTLLVLILKVPRPELVSQFQLISLCTVPYKLLTKVIVNRLKPVMPLLVEENQTNFIGGRHIIDNVVIAQEVVHSMHIKKEKMGWMAITIDLEKAYDRLWWSFIENTLKEARIPWNIIQLIMTCVSSTTMQILQNGSFTEEFTSTRGVWQGDPISPYLFVLKMEILGHAIKKSVLGGNWKPIVLSKGGPPLSHLFFVDDLFLFREASLEIALAMRTILDIL